MSKKQSPRKPAPASASGRRNKGAAAITLALMCGIGTSLLAQVDSRKKGKRDSGEASVMSLSAGSPSKEYIYAGGRLVATEEPVSACTVSISPTSASFPATSTTGGVQTGVVSVTANCNWKGNRINVFATEGKGGRDRVVPLTENASRWLTRYITDARPELAAGIARAGGKSNRRSSIRKLQSRAQTSALWLTVEGRRLSKQMIGQRITEYAKQAGIKATPHTFRHSCASHLLRGGASIRHVQRLLGHRGLETTEIYTHVDIEDLKRIVERASWELSPERLNCETDS